MDDVERSDTKMIASSKKQWESVLIDGVRKGLAWGVGNYKKNIEGFPIVGGLTFNLLLRAAGRASTNPVSALHSSHIRVG